MPALARTRSLFPQERGSRGDRMIKVALLITLAVVAVPSLAQAQGRQDQGELRGLKLGLNAQEMTTRGFGEFACGSIFLKQRCEKVTPERALSVEARFLRKPGQSDVDPVTGDYTTGQFESWTRFELLDPSYRKP